MSRYFTQWDADVIGATIAGWTSRNGTPTRVAAYGMPAVKRRYLPLTGVAATAAVISWDSLDADSSRASFDLVTCFAVSDMAADAGYLYARGTVYTDWYRLEVNASGLSFDKRVASATTAGVATAAKTFTAGHSYFVRFQGIGTAIKARAWDASLGMAGEPTAWDISTTDSGVTAAGWIGLGVFDSVSSGVAFPFNFFAVGTSGDAAVAPRTNAEYLTWLDSANANRRVLVEMSALGYDSGGAPFTQTVNVYLSTGGYTSKAWDAPASRHYDAWVVSAPRIRSEMNLALSGRASVGLGSLVVANPDGARDDWLRMKWKRDYVRVYLGDDDWPKHDFRLQVLGTLGDPTAPQVDHLEFPISDLLEKLARQLQTTRYSGSEPVTGQLKPLLAGSPIFMEPVVASADLLTRQLHDGALNAIGEVFDNGISLVTGGSVISANAAVESMTCASAHGLLEGMRVVPLSSTIGGFVNGTTYYVSATGLTTTDFRVSATLGGGLHNLTSNGTAGFTAYAWHEDLANGKIELVSEPFGRVMVKSAAREASGGDGNKPASVIAEMIFTRFALSLNHKDSTAFAAALAAVPNEIGLPLYDEPVTALEWLDRISKGTNIWYGMTPDGLLQIGRLDLPAASAVMNFTASDVSERSMRLERKKKPCASIAIRMAKVWVNGGKLDLPAVSTIADTRLLTEYQTITALVAAGSGVPIDDYPNQGDVDDFPVMDSLYRLESESPNESNRIDDFVKKPLGVFTFQTRLRAATLEIGQTIELEHSRMGWKGWDSGDPASPDNTATIDSTKAVVIGKEIAFDGSAFPVRLTVFRQIPGHYAEQDLN